MHQKDNEIENINSVRTVKRAMYIIANTNYGIVYVAIILMSWVLLMTLADSRPPKISKPNNHTLHAIHSPSYIYMQYLIFKHGTTLTSPLLLSPFCKSA